MAQQYIKMKATASSSWVTVKQPDAGLEYNFETTYQDDATRTQQGKGVFTAMFTVESFSYKATDLTKAEMTQILQFAIPGRSFYMHYYSPYYGIWRDDQFYVGRGSLSIGRLNENKERFESVSFNIVGINPI